MRLTFAPVLVALVAALPLAAPAAAQEPAPRIVVTGEGRAQTAPDRASFTAGVQAEALQAGEALAAASERMRAVFAALEGAGVAPEDLRTSELSVDPVWDHGPDGRQPRVRGFAATNLVTVTVRPPAEDAGTDALGRRLGTLIDAVGAAGANRIQGIGFEAADPVAALTAARRAAVEDARARAATLADAAGVALGPVLSIREGPAGGPGPMLARAEMAMDAAPVAPGVVDLAVRVEIVYAIE